MVDNGGTRQRSSRRWLWIIAGIAGVGAVCAVVGIWHLPDRMYPGTSDGAVQARAALQGGLLTAAAALTAVAGGLIALDETRQANAEVRRANAETQRANRDTHVRELYVEAVKLLNDAEQGIRLAGIYALERIAVDSPADQRTVVEVLSAFVRTRSTDPALRLSEPTDGHEPGLARLAADIRAAVQVLGRLPRLPDVPRADFHDANLTGPASLAGINLDNSNLSGVVLMGADLTEARLYLADLSDADLSGTTLIKADLNDATLAGINLSGANLANAELSTVDLTDAHLYDANLTGADLSNATLTSAGLYGATLTGAWLPGTDFRGLFGVDFDRVQMDGATLTGAVLCGADLTRALGLSQEQVDSVEGDEGTRLPEGLLRPASWGPEEPPDEE